MTESEWLMCDDPKSMVRYLIGTDAPRVQAVDVFPNCRTTDRKLRLFACACYHRISHVLPYPDAREGVATAERFADESASEDERQRVEAHLFALVDAIEGQWRASRGAERAALEPMYAALALALQALWREAPKSAYYAPHTAQFHLGSITNPDAADTRDPANSPTGRAEARAQCGLLREIVGNPFRLAFDPAWRTDTAVSLARAMYEARDFSAMPILADALQDAGCDSEDVLNHCRQPGPHVRGCRVVDLVLGK
jgi:hypothetical protein